MADIEDDPEREVLKTQQVREWLGDEFLVDFFRKIQELPGSGAVHLINQRLDEGQALDEIFTWKGRSGFYLTAEERDENLVDLSFGYVAGPLAGDGCHYVLDFSRDGKECTVMFGGVIDH